ncbi:MAG TPA: hypothetical protein VIJ23_16250 [Mycobacterium sp.]
MPGFLLHLGAQVTCAHLGQAVPTVTNPRVVVSTQPAVLITSPYLISACTFPPPTAANGPCVNGQFTVGTVRVTSLGQPLAIIGGTGLCAPTGTPLLPVAAQTRVVAT